MKSVRCCQRCESRPGLSSRRRWSAPSTRATAGFAPSDVIYAVNRVQVRGPGELRALLEKLRISDPVVVQLQRRGELIYLAFTLE